MSALHLLEYLPRPHHGTRRRQKRHFGVVLAPVVTVLLDAEADPAARTLLVGFLQINQEKEAPALYIMKGLTAAGARRAGRSKRQAAYMAIKQWLLWRRSHFWTSGPVCFLKVSLKFSRETVGL